MCIRDSLLELDAPDVAAGIVRQIIGEAVG